MMQSRYVMAGLLLAVALAGCQRTSSSYVIADEPPRRAAPLQPQPVPRVQGSQLPPPSAPAASPSQFPSAPAASPAPLPGGGSAAPEKALDVRKEALVGNWRVSGAGSTCDMFLTLTNLGSGLRGGTRGCVGELTTMGSWEVAGKAVQFRNRSGDVVGRVYRSADNRYDGTLNSGQPVSLSR